MGMVSIGPKVKLVLLLYLGFAFSSFIIFLFEDGILMSKVHESLNVSFTHKIPSASYSVVLYRTGVNTISYQILLRSLGHTPTPLQLYSAGAEQLVNR